MRYITNEPISGEKALLTFLSNLYGKKSFVDWPIPPNPGHIRVNPIFPHELLYVKVKGITLSEN